MSQLGQQILRLLDKNWISFFKAIKDYKKYPNKYLGRPKLPKYKDIDKGRNICIFPMVREKENNIILPKILSSYKLVSKLNGKVHQLRIIPKNSYYIIEVIKEIGYKDLKVDNKRYLSIDLGIDNLVTMVNNIGLEPIITNGKGLKSINKYFNKKISYYKSILECMNHKKTSYKLNKFWLKRNNIIIDNFHKISRFIINYCINNNINTIIIGNNKNWKQNCNIGKVNNQTFVQIPHSTLINMIIYKAEEEGINTIITEESYTSKSSFLDNDFIPLKYEKDKEYIFSGKRIKRGLYKSSTGKLINADVNGAYNIMKKVIGDVLNYNLGINLNNQPILGLVVNPIKVNIF